MGGKWRPPHHPKGRPLPHPPQQEPTVLPDLGSENSTKCYPHGDGRGSRQPSTAVGGPQGAGRAGVQSIPSSTGLPHKGPNEVLKSVTR